MTAPTSQPPQPLSRERLIEMLENFANGQYQAISPNVVGEAARQLRYENWVSDPEVTAALLERAARALCKHLQIDPDGVDMNGAPFWSVWVGAADAVLREATLVVTA